MKRFFAVIGLIMTVLVVLFIKGNIMLVFPFIFASISTELPSTLASCAPGYTAIARLMAEASPCCKPIVSSRLTTDRESESVTPAEYYQHTSFLPLETSAIPVFTFS